MAETSVFDHNSVTAFVRANLESRGLSARKLSLAARIHTAYFSRVLNGHAQFSHEQLFRIGEQLHLDQSEQRFLRLLRDHENASLPSLRFAFEHELHALALEHTKVSKRIKDGRTTIIHPSTPSPDNERLYYGQVLTAKVHMLLTIGKYRRDVGLMAADLGITRVQLNLELSKLERLGILARVGREQDIRLAVESIHLDEMHPLSRQNHVNWRIDVIRHLTATPEGHVRPDEIHLSVTYTASTRLKEEARKKIQELVMWLKERVEEDSRAKREDCLGMMLLDLY